MSNFNLFFFIFRWNHLNESIRSGMAVLDVAIPTGYWIQQQKLDAYILSRRVRNLQRARYLHNKVLFYFDFVSRITTSFASERKKKLKTSYLCLQLDHEDICVNFTIERWYPVANMSRYLPIRVYDYYAPGKHSNAMNTEFQFKIFNSKKIFSL